MSWKQPIPKGLEKRFGDDYGCQALYKELIYRSANDDGYFTDKRGKTTEIKKGQVVFGRNRFALYLGWNDKTTERRLQKLQKVYKQVTMQASMDFTIVTIINYDKDTDMTKQTTKQRPSNDQAMTTSESNKSNKSIKIITEKKKKSPLQAVETTSGREPMTELEMFSMAMRLNVQVADIENTHQAVWDSIECGDKYKVKDIKATVRQWVTRAVRRNEIALMDEVTRQTTALIANRKYAEAKEAANGS